MKVIYRKSIIDKIIEEKNRACRDSKVIEKIQLTNDEFFELRAILAIDYPECDHIKGLKNRKNLVFMGVDLEVI